MKQIGILETLLPMVVGKSANGDWVKQEFVIRYDEVRRICVAAWGEKKVSRLRAIPLESRIEVDYTITAREYNGRWYNDIAMQDIAILRAEAVKSLPERDAEEHPQREGGAE